MNRTGWRRASGAGAGRRRSILTVRLLRLAARYGWIPSIRCALDAEGPIPSSSLCTCWECSHIGGKVRGSTRFYIVDSSSKAASSPSLR